MEKNTKENLKKLIEAGSIKPESSNVASEQSLIGVLFSKLSKSDLFDFKEKMFDKNFISIMKDTDLVACIDEFFKNNLNMSETSKNAFLHRNTLVYRIDKIQKLTGFNLRNFNDAVTFKILIMIYSQFN